MNRKPEIRARIVHLSDLHFSWRKNLNYENQVRHIIRELDPLPNLIIASGDLADQPYPWFMRRARKFLDGLCEVGARTEPAKLLVVPGNHDYKFKGNIGVGKFSRVPFHSFFPNFNLDPAPRNHWSTFCRLLCGALWSKKLRDAPAYWLDPQLGLIVYLFNSNSFDLMLACGQVSVADLQEIDQIKKKAHEIEEQNNLATLYRVAVVHHHPLPTNYFPRKRKDRLFDSFMVFYNARRFVSKLCDNGFHLVLHGHRHYASFSRIAFEDPGVRSRSIVVAAAGTATAHETDDERGYHLNIIDIYQDDQARMESRFFDDVEPKREATRNFVLHDLEDVRAQRERALENFWGFRTHRFRKRIVIGADGCAKVTMEHEKCRPAGSEQVRSCPIFLDLQRPSYVRKLREYNKERWPENSRLSEKRKITHSRLAANIEFGELSDPFYFAYQYQLMNAYAFSRTEAAGKYGEAQADFEFATVDCDQPCDELVLEVDFPVGWQSPAEPHFEVLFKRTFRTPDYEDEIGAEHEAHDEERLRTREGLAKDLVHCNPDGVDRTFVRYRFVCQNPIPGFLYRIRWDLPFVSGVVPSKLHLHAQTALTNARKYLLTVAGNAAERINKWELKYASLQLYVTELARDVEDILDLGETPTVSLMVFDPRDVRLKIVLSNGGAISTLWRHQLAAGEGCAGFAFEETSGVLYNPRLDPDGYYLHPNELPSSDLGAGGKEHSVLISIPWVFDGETVGVVNVGSYSEGSGLQSVFSRVAEGESQLADDLMTLVNVAANGIIHEVEDEQPPNAED